MNTRIKLIATTVFFTLFCTALYSQTHKNLEEINQVWKKFYEAFEMRDVDKMKEIHSKDLIRVSGGKNILDYNAYMNGYHNQFERAKKEERHYEISLRFFERINNTSTASERGIYKLKIMDKDEEVRTYYGQFHVLFVKENNAWKILMDYDSNEGGTIGEEEYQNAFDIDALENFVKE